MIRSSKQLTDKNTEVIHQRHTYNTRKDYLHIDRQIWGTSWYFVDLRVHFDFHQRTLPRRLSSSGLSILAAFSPRLAAGKTLSLSRQSRVRSRRNRCLWDTTERTASSRVSRSFRGYSIWTLRIGMLAPEEESNRMKWDLSLRIIRCEFMWDLF